MAAHWFSWVTLGAPVKWWLANRAATSAVLFTAWRRLRARRWFWFAAALFNILSLTALVLLVRWVRR